jgi:hypothetical protein
MTLALALPHNIGNIRLVRGRLSTLTTRRGRGRRHTTWGDGSHGWRLGSEICSITVISNTATNPHKWGMITITSR